MAQCIRKIVSKYQFAVLVVINITSEHTICTIITIFTKLKITYPSCTHNCKNGISKLLLEVRT